MAKTAIRDAKSTKTRPALTAEAKEGQLIQLATDLAEEQLRNGTASSQVITHYLKLGTTQARLELEKAKLENEMIKAKTEALQSQKATEELYAEALKAMQSYSGQGGDSSDDELFDD